MKVRPGSTIAVVGASARAAVFSLLRAGYHAIAADLFADVDLQRQCKATRISPYPEGFAVWLATTECDAWLYTGALENYPALVDHLSGLRPLLGHDGELLCRVRDPLQLQSALTNEGLPFPETKLSNEKLDVEDNWLGKSYRGSCGSGIGLPTDAPYVQRRIEGVPLSAVFQGNRLLGVTRQLVGEAWTGASAFQYCGTIAPWLLPASCEQQLCQLGQVLHDQFGMTELYGVDLILDGEQLWTIEVNPRYTAAVEVVEQAYGISAFGPNHAQALSSCVGKVVLFAKTDCTITSEFLTRVTPSEPTPLVGRSHIDPWRAVADIPPVGTEISAGQPILTLFASGESCEQVQIRLKQRVDEIEQLLYRKASRCV